LGCEVFVGVFGLECVSFAVEWLVAW
jgi:hypothetical protein